MGISRNGAHSAWLPLTDDTVKRGLSRAFAHSASRGRITGMIKLKDRLRLTPLALAIGLGLLAGCSTVNELIGSEESVDYKSTVRGDPLSIPPDLTQAHQGRSEEHTSELQSRGHLVCRLLLDKKKDNVDG